MSELGGLEVGLMGSLCRIVVEDVRRVGFGRDEVRTTEEIFILYRKVATFRARWPVRAPRTLV